MASKKDFSAMEIVTGDKVATAVSQATSKRGQQGKASAEEIATRTKEMRTQGRKGCKAQRINMAFSPENHSFIKVMAGLHGTTMTEFANIIVDRYREEHPDLYQKALQLIAEARTNGKED